VIGFPEKQSLERPIQTQSQLLVEGRVPEMFFREMVLAYGLQDRIEVRTFGDISKDTLKTYLDVFTQKVPFKEKVKRLGIIRDAEKLPADAAFQSVQSALEAAKLPVPAEVNRFTDGDLSVGVFILPNCQDAGMLETLCLCAVEEAENTSGSRVLPCVDRFFSCLADSGQSAPANPTKARFAGYVLARDVIDPQLGQWARKKQAPWESKAFAPLKQFLRDLAG
jgi:hypothetical protein